MDEKSLGVKTYSRALVSNLLGSKTLASAHYLCYVKITEITVAGLRVLMKKIFYILFGQIKIKKEAIICSE